MSPGSPAPLYGIAGWAIDNSAGWSALGKGFLFVVIVAAVAVYMRYSRKMLEREDVGYEKNRA